MSLTACKKDIGTVQIDEVTGKWQQTRLNLNQYTRLLFVRLGYNGLFYKAELSGLSIV